MTGGTGGIHAHAPGTANGALGTQVPNHLPQVHHTPHLTGAAPTAAAALAHPQPRLLSAHAAAKPCLTSHRRGVLLQCQAPPSLLAMHWAQQPCLPAQMHVGRMLLFPVDAPLYHSATEAAHMQVTRHARRVYVGGLPPTATDVGLTEIFNNALMAVGGVIEAGACISYAVYAVCQPHVTTNRQPGDEYVLQLGEKVCVCGVSICGGDVQQPGA